MSERHPRKQGLKHSILILNLKTRYCSRATSTKTRIETAIRQSVLIVVRNVQSDIHENIKLTTSRRRRTHSFQSDIHENKD